MTFAELKKEFKELEIHSNNLDSLIKKQDRIIVEKNKDLIDLMKEKEELEIYLGELKSSNETQEKIITNKNQTILEITKAKEKLEKENISLNDALKQLYQEKRILLHKLTKEIKVRIEFESELILLHKEAEDLPF